jgi:hypothetical protein
MHIFIVDYIFVFRLLVSQTVKRILNNKKEWLVHDQNDNMQINREEMDTSKDIDIPEAAANDQQDHGNIQVDECSVHIDDAVNGLRKTISYLKNNPESSGGFVQILCTVLNHIQRTAGNSPPRDDQLENEETTDSPFNFSNTSRMLVKDTELISDDVDPDRAVKTLPFGLVVNKSTVSGKQIGVFTNMFLTIDMWFGPYQGDTFVNMDSENNHRYIGIYEITFFIP